MGLARVLEAMGDDELVALLRARPDLAAQPLADFGALAQRASTWWSVSAAVELVDRFALQLTHVLCLFPDGASVQTTADLLGPSVTDQDVRDGVQRLRSLAVVWGDDAALTVAPVLRQQIAYPARLGPPLAELLAREPRPSLDALAGRLDAASDGGAGGGGAGGASENKGALLGRLAAVLGDPYVVETLLAVGPDEARRLVDRLAVEGPICKVPAGSAWYGGARRGPGYLDWLLAHGLLVQLDWTTAALPREVALARRGGRPYADLSPRRPTPSTQPVDPVTVDRSASTAAESALRAVTAMLTAVEQEPASPLKAGGLGVREVKRLAKAASLSEADAARLLEVAAAARLIPLAVGPEVSPTGAFDEWSSAPPAERWLTLVRAWLDAPRAISLAGQPDERGKPVPALLAGLQSPDSGRRRRSVLGVLAEVPAGERVDTSSIDAAVTWEAPLAWAGHLPDRELVGEVLAEAALLGVVGNGALTTAARLLVGGDVAGAVSAASRLVPPPERTFVVQADLTCITSPGLDHAVRQELDLMADVESNGAATVLRFSQGSVRRALDAGRSAEQILRFLEQHAARGVPQPLTYLVGDTGRRHGGVRVGAVSCYVRSEDPALLAEVVRLRRASALGLRQIAPTVVVGSASPSAVLEALRAGGLLPAEEGGDGTIVVRAPKRRRQPTPKPFARGRTAAPAADVGQLEAVVASLRSGPGPGRRRPAQGPRSTDDDHFMTELYLRLVQAQQTREQVRLGHHRGGDCETVVTVDAQVVSVTPRAVRVRGPERRVVSVPLDCVEWVDGLGDDGGHDSAFGHDDAFDDDAFDEDDDDDGRDDCAQYRDGGRA